jgi:ATP-dependent RNA helicase RhlB
VGILSGEIAQDKRIKTLDQFKQGKIQILIATDVAGRGIHVDGVSHVVNYTLPEHAEDYVHRIGRTGRAGESGISISFACEDDAFLLADLEKAIGQKLPLQRLEGYHLA